MTRFSDSHLKIPAMRPVCPVAKGQSYIDRTIPDRRTEELRIELFALAADRNGPPSKQKITSSQEGQ